MLEKISTRAPENLDKQDTKKKTIEILEEINELQYLLYAERKRSLLVILQGIDASGKDGVIRNVFAGLNPQGVTVKSFKEPSTEELDHDFLWRIHAHVPAKGMIQIFNRSQYEDILITRVHELIDDKTAKKRIRAINDFEKMLSDNHTHILKFYLHISHEEQRERLKERLDNPKKHWKYSETDLAESKRWDEYMQMYEECFERCNDIPWTIVPADQNWYKEYVVATTVRDLLKNLKMEYPAVNSNK